MITIASIIYKSDVVVVLSVTSLLYMKWSEYIARWISEMDHNGYIKGGIIQASEKKLCVNH